MKRFREGRRKGYVKDKEGRSNRLYIPILVLDVDSGLLDVHLFPLKTREGGKDKRAKKDRSGKMEKGHLVKG